MIISIFHRIQGTKKSKTHAKKITGFARNVGMLKRAFKRIRKHDVMV